VCFVVTVSPYESLGGDYISHMPPASSLDQLQTSNGYDTQSRGSSARPHNEYGVTGSSVDSDRRKITSHPSDELTTNKRSSNGGSERTADRSTTVNEEEAEDRQGSRRKPRPSIEYAAWEMGGGGYSRVDSDHSRNTSRHTDGHTSHEVVHAGSNRAEQNTPYGERQHRITSHCELEDTPRTGCGYDSRSQSQRPSVVWRDDVVASRRGSAQSQDVGSRASSRGSERHDSPFSADRDDHPSRYQPAAVGFSDSAPSLPRPASTDDRDDGTVLRPSWSNVLP